jgi:hypothetical protein
MSADTGKADTPANLSGSEPGALPTPQTGGSTPVTPPGAQGAERGTPSPQLQAAMGEQQPVDSGGDYEAITDAVPEAGVFTIVGGYLDEDRVVHNEVHVKALSGNEEELISNDNIDILDRLNGLMVACTERIGTITDKSKITQAIHRMPMGTRRHLLICIRRATHWKRHKDLYEMDVRCPIEDCQAVGSYQVDLGTLETFEMTEPEKRDFTVELADSGDEIVWRVASLPQERVFRAIARSKADEHRLITFSILARLVSINGEEVRLDLHDFIQGQGATKKVQLSKRAGALYPKIRGWTSGDRDQIRESFFTNEPDVDTEIDIECTACHRDFKGDLDVTQRTFFFPSATSRRSKRRSST